MDAQTYAETGQRADKKGGRVIGGQPAPEGAYPWQVSIALARRPLTVGHFCGGVLVAELWVVTAAHCVYDVKDVKAIQIMYGSNVLSKPKSFREVQAIIVHPGWNDDTMENDIALLKTAGSASDGVPIKLVQKGATGQLYDGVIGFVSGWGQTREGGANSDVLRHVGVQVVPRVTCNAREAYNGAIKKSMFCAGFQEGNKDACQGDSGGPIMVSDRLGSYALAGVVSGGDGCGAPNKYGVYTLIPDYVEWIRQATR
jgi:secreted trypsin-like serine protease